MSKNREDDEAGVPFWATSLPVTAAEPETESDDASEHSAAIPISEEGEEIIIPVTPTKEKTEVAKPEVPEVSPVIGFLEEIDTILEEEGLLVDTGKSYTPDAAGFSEMLKDTIAAKDAAWEVKLRQAVETERDSIERGNVLRAEDMDTSDEQHAEHLLTEYYKRTDWEDDEIAEKLQTLKELGELSKEANVAKRYMVKVEKAEENSRIEAKKERETADQRYIDEYVAGVKSDIDSRDEIVGFKLDKKTKDGFKSYLFDVDKDGKTKAQKAGEDPEHRTRVAFLDYMNYSKKDMEVKVKTELATEQNKKNSRYSTVGQSAKGANVREVEEVGLSTTLNKIGIFSGNSDND